MSSSALENVQKDIKKNMWYPWYSYCRNVSFVKSPFALYSESQVQVLATMVLIHVSLYGYAFVDGIYVRKHVSVAMLGKLVQSPEF